MKLNTLVSKDFILIKISTPVKCRHNLTKAILYKINIIYHIIPHCNIMMPGLELYTFQEFVTYDITKSISLPEKRK